MRILVPTTWYPSVDDPVTAVFIRRHVEALSLENDVEVLALLPEEMKPLPASPALPRLSVRHVPMTLSDPVSVARAAAKVRGHRHRAHPDVVHSMAFSALPFAAVAGPSPWVHTEHWSGTTEPMSIGRMWNAVRGARHLLRLPDRVTVVSSDMARRLQRYTRRSRTDVVGNVVEVCQPLPPVVRPGIRLLGVGRLIALKDPILAVRIIGRLKAGGHDATLRWAGSGPLRNDVVMAARREGVEERIELLGSVPPSQLDAHFAWSTSLLLPTKHETFCVAAAESLAHGRPVVMGASGGQRDFMTDHTGRLVASRDPSEWADAVMEVHAQRHQPADLAAAVDRFRPERIADAFAEVYARARAQRRHFRG